MKMKRMRFPVWIAAIALLLALALQTAQPVNAGTTPTGSLEVVSYTVLKNGAPFTGSIYIGDVVTIQVSILDTRITSGSPVPSATLNTASFTIPGQGNITVLNPPGVSVGTGGCTYTLQFAGMTYTGTPNAFACNISYTGISPPVPMENISIVLNQLVQYVPPDPQPPAPGPDPRPTDFVLKDARFGTGIVYAGETFVLSVVILATNGTYPVENVSVTFNPPEQLTFADGSSVVYVGTMRPNTSTTVSVALLASANIQEGSYPVSISVSGINQQTGQQAGGGQMTVSIPVLQPERFEIFNAALPTDLTAGVDDGLGFSTVTLVNKGRGTVGNVTIDIVGDGLRTDVGIQYLGNVAGGEQKTADFILYADVPGLIDGYVVVSYENVRGEQKTLERPFTVNVSEAWFEDPGFDDPGFVQPEVPVATGPPAWVWIIIIAACAVVAATLLVRRHKKKKAAAEAALDEIDDDD